MQRTVLYIAILFLSFAANAQPERILGNWQLHFPYKDVVGVEDAGSKVYVAGLLSLYSYEKENGNIDIFDKVSPLNDVGVKSIDYERNTKVLAIAYENSNLDILVDGKELVNIPDIKNKVVAGTKNINGVYCFGSKVYLSTDIGLVVINVSKKEVQSAYVIGKTGDNVRVNDAVVTNDILLAATAEGVKLAPVNAANLQNYLSWTHFDYSLGLPAKFAAHVEVANGKYYAAISDTLFQFSGGSWSKLAYDSGWVIKNLETIDGKLYISEWKGNDFARVGILDNSGVLTYVVPPAGVRTLQYQPDNAGNVWVADLYNGMIKNGEKILPNGPFTTSCFSVKAQGDNMFVAGGGTNTAFDYTYNVAGMYMLNEANRQWKNYNIYNTQNLQGFLDVIGVSTNSSGTKAYFCSNLDGIAMLRADDGFILHFDYTNSPLEAAVGSPGATRVTSIAVDRDENVWMTNFNTYSPLVLLKADGTWKRFPLLSLDQLGKKMIIDRNGYKWIPTRKPDGIMVYYEGDDIDNSNDDVTRFLSSGGGNGNLNNVVVNAIVEDKDGDVWVGTDEGIEIFYCAGSVLSQNSCDAQRIVVERDGFNGYLFGTEVIRSITIDAANRKWVGTNSGAWLISANGKEELLHFTTENSPLPSNFVSDITVNNTTGEVFFATEKGIASFLGDAISGGETCTGAFVYPNPVKPEYTGPIAIKGLVDDAYVKITDVSGLLVYQGKANGGQMIWNGNDYNGRRAASGIYTVFSSTPDGKGGKCVGKIAFIN